MLQKVLVSRQRAHKDIRVIIKVAQAYGSVQDQSLVFSKQLISYIHLRNHVTCLLDLYSFAGVITLRLMRSEGFYPARFGIQKFLSIKL